MFGALLTTVNLTGVDKTWLMLAFASPPIGEGVEAHQGVSLRGTPASDIHQMRPVWCVCRDE